MKIKEFRKRYNLRVDFENELKEICRVQNLNETIYKRLWKAIIWQRPLRSQKGLIGYCTFESPKMDETNKKKYIKSGKKRCPISHPLYEEFRTWVFINNLKIKLPGNIDKLNYLQEKIYPLFFNASNDFKLSSIIKQLRKDNGIIEAKFTPDTKVVSCKLLNSFESLFQKNWKKEFGWDEALVNLPKKCNYSFEDIWHVLFSFDGPEALRKFATDKLKLNNDDNIIKFSKIKLQQGYATLSLSAIKKILPYLYQGFIYSEAIYLANLHKVIGEKEITPELAKSFASIIRDIIKEHNQEKALIGLANSLISSQLNSEHKYRIEDDRQLDNAEKQEVEAKLIDTFGTRTWDEKKEEEKKYLKEILENKYLEFLRKPFTTKKEDLFIPIPRLHDKIFKYLRETYDIPDKNKRYLWHPSEQETYPDAKEINNIKQLGDPQPISHGFKNPMALKTLHKLKQLINYLLQIQKIDEDTRVVIEIARELNDANRRKAIEKWQREREKENDEYKQKVQEIIDEHHLNIGVNNKEIIEKYRLWTEQNKICLYTGNPINCTELFDGTKYDFEHTIPASMSFDNELKNITIADSKYNREVKKKRIPSELENYSVNATINGIEYSAIEPRLQFIKDKVEQLESLYEEWKNKSKFASTKEIKDAIIQRKHLINLELSYWRKKLDTFTCKEYKDSWRNSQLRDTQIVTKYALPYLKTVFKKTEVQKGSVTAAFREIYKIQPRLEIKDRNKHSHHAIDAAVLTLIPPAATRDKILLRYNEDKDINPNNTYHEKPSGWKNFETKHILSIGDDVLINFQSQHRTLVQTYKNVRKRGKQQYVKTKDAKGKWQYKLDKNGKKIPLVAKGDTIRGKLHKESFFGAIKMPMYDEVNGKHIPLRDDNGSFIFQQNEKSGNELFIVERENDLSKFTKLEDFEIIVDPNLKTYIQGEIQKRINNGKKFSEAILEPIWAFGKNKDKNGRPINPIRHIRCRVKSGGGGFLNNPAIVKSIESFKSGKDYKQNIYAQNGETAICAFYQGTINDELIRIIQPYSTLDISKINMKGNISVDKVLSPQIETVLKKKKYLVPLYTTLKVGQKVIFYEEEMNELKSENYNTKKLSTRLYLITKFEDGKISFRHHLNSMSEEDLKKEMKKIGSPDSGASSFNFSYPIPKLRLSKSSFNFAIEGKHFELKLDGIINWLF